MICFDLLKNTCNHEHFGGDPGSVVSIIMPVFCIGDLNNTTFSLFQHFPVLLFRNMRPCEPLGTWAPACGAYAVFFLPHKAARQQWQLSSCTVAMQQSCNRKHLQGQLEILRKLDSERPSAAVAYELGHNFRQLSSFIRQRYGHNRPGSNHGKQVYRGQDRGVLKSTGVVFDRRTISRGLDRGGGGWVIR